MRYRTKEGIVADLLGAALHSDDGTGVGIATILRRANLSYTRAAKILRELVRAGLMVEVNRGSRTFYALTEDGHHYLVEYKAFSEFTRPLSLRL